MAHGPKNDYPHILLKDSPWRVNKRGIVFCLDLLLFSRKLAKTVQDDDHFKYGGHKCAEYQHKNVAPEKCKASWLFFFLYVCVGDIGKLFKPKTRSFCLTLSSQLVFKYHLYFTAVKSNLENFFKTPFPYAV